MKCQRKLLAAAIHFGLAITRELRVSMAVRGVSLRSLHIWVEAAQMVWFVWGDARTTRQSRVAPMIIIERQI